jgi:hypothetical protein
MTFSFSSNGRSFGPSFYTVSLARGLPVSSNIPSSGHSGTQQERSPRFSIFTGSMASAGV